MASLQSRSELTARPGETGIRRPGALREPSQEDIPPGLDQKTRKQVVMTRSSGQTNNQPKPSSRIPYSSGLRRPSDGQAERLFLGHQPQSWGSVGSGSSGRSASYQKATTASPSGQLGSKVNRNVLRRKASGLPQNAGSQRNNSQNDSNRTSSSSSNPRSQTSLEVPSGTQFDRGLTESPMEIRVAQQVELPTMTATAHTVTIISELDRYQHMKPPAHSDSPGPDVPFRLTTQNLSPPTPLFSGTSSQISAISGSPCTRFSESPGTGPYSRDTTPTSMSSQSPGLVAPMRFPAPRLRQGDLTQTRPPVTRRRAGSIPNEEASVSAVADPHGLAAVRETLTSSSSNSTVRDADRKDGEKSKKTKKRLSPLPPSPPPRKSSQKFRNSSRDEDESSAKPVREPPAQLESRVDSPVTAATSSPFGPRPGVESSRVTLPVRPSRDGITDLQSQLGLPFPVVHSNLSSTSMSERRQSGAALPPQAPFSRPFTPSGLERQNPSAKGPTARQPTPAPRPYGFGVGSSEESQGRSVTVAGRTTRTPSPGIAGLKSRFPIFSRKNKNTETSQPDKKEKPARKGPAAGTGHEGYGRLGAVRRRSNSMANATRGLASATMSSQESLSSDPFLSERLAPVVNAVGEIVENRNTSTSDLSRTESDQSLPVFSKTNWGARPANADSKNSSQVSLASRDGGTRTTLWPSAFPRDEALTDVPAIPAAVSSSFGTRRPSDRSDTEALAMKSTLVFRRSMQKLRAGDQQPPRIPKPIVTRAEVVSPFVTSLDTSVLSDDSMFDPLAPPQPLGRGRRGSTSKPMKVASGATPKKLTKRARSPRKWNFFGRSQSQPAVVEKNTSPAARTVTATVKAAVPSKPVAFYTMMDSSEQEDVDPPDLEAVLREARALDPRASPAPAPAQEAPPKRPSAGEGRSSATGQRPSIGERRLSSGERRPSVEEIRPSVGERRPSVGERRPSIGERRPSLTRPTPRFARGGTSELGSPAQLNSRRAVTSPMPSTVRSTEPPVPKERRSEPSVEPSPPPIRPGTGRPSRLPQVGRIPKVISARPEQTSPKSFSRPFNRVSMWLQPPRIDVQDPDSLAKGATPPRSSTPELTKDGTATATKVTKLPAESQDDVPEEAPEAERTRKEFLAFSRRKNSQGTVTTTSSSSGMLSYAEVTAVIPEPNAPLVEDEIWDEYNDLLGDDGLRVPPSAGSSAGKPFHLEIYSTKLEKKAEEPLDSPMIHPPPVQSLAWAMNPGRDSESEKAKEQPTSSIYSVDMTDKIREVLEILDVSQPPATPFSVSEFVGGYGERNNSVSSAKQIEKVSQPKNPSPRHSTRHSNASGSSQGSEDNTPLAQVILRVGSMTVSKWLTFGHVLFSPIREDIVPMVGSLKRHSILVIDGLGNDDWSFYASETYPAATFFNLSPRSPPPEGHQSSTGGFPLTPPNHHQVQFLSHMDKIPFGPHSFTSVVYRFPAAAAESHYRNMIAEARRVLNPGGFIELSILDVDLNNMGNHCRRSVRRLKERIHAAAPDMCLGSASDLVLRLLGRKGFVDIKTCRVGVPIASAVTPSSESSGSAAGQRSSVEKKARRPRDDRSLAEMMSDEGVVADESITKMVAKVGRWWYSRCYETGAAIGPSGRSMWNDRALLRECEEWGTSLKLMVCYARVPDGRARMASI